MSLQGPRRRIVHATLFELFAIVLTSLTLMVVAGESPEHAGVLALVISLIAMSWNVVYNAGFEAWERRQVDRRRTVRRRVAHAVGFELGLLILTVPLIAWWLSMGWWAALLADIGLTLFFLVYGYVFNWAFDHVFGLPDSASA